jgi:hypothetical protein
VILVCFDALAMGEFLAVFFERFPVRAVLIRELHSSPF